MVAPLCSYRCRNQTGGPKGSFPEAGGPHIAEGAPNCNSRFPGIFAGAPSRGAGDAAPVRTGEKAGPGGVWAWPRLWGGACSQAPAQLTLLSVARITRQQASTGPTPLSDREPVARPLELSAHRLWLGEMPGSWAEESTQRQVRASGDVQQPAVGRPYLVQVRHRPRTCTAFSEQGQELKGSPWSCRHGHRQPVTREHPRKEWLR